VEKKNVEKAGEKKKNTIMSEPSEYQKEPRLFPGGHVPYAWKSIRGGQYHRIQYFLPAHPCGPVAFPGNLKYRPHPVLEHFAYLLNPVSFPA
jgi:hypothetical protein